MGLLSLVRGAPEGQRIEIGSDGHWWGTYGPWPGLVNDATDMPYVTREVAAGLPGIGRGAELIAGVMSQLRPWLYRDALQPNRVSERLDTPPLLLDPTPDWHPLPQWLGSVTEDLFYGGDAFAYRGPEVVDFRGYPLRLPLLAPERFAYDKITGEYLYTTDGDQMRIPAGDLIHMAVGVRSGSRFGLGILGRYQHELKLMLATEDSQYVLMRDGKPMGILSLGIDVNPQQASEYKAGFLKAVAESGVAAIGNADFKPVQWNAADLSMIPTREFNLRLAADICGIPGYLLGVPSESRVYSNMETEWSTFIKTTLGRYVEAIQSGLSRAFPRGQTVLLNTDRLLRAETKTRFDIYASGIASGVLEVNEARAMEDMPPRVMPEPVVPPTDDGGDDDNDAGEPEEDTDADDNE
jgi:HK97 family phage portal protein